MTAWYSKDLGDGVDALRPTEEIQEAYMLQAVAGRLPIESAVFSIYDLRVNVVTVYFSPGLERLAQLFGAKLCDKPVNREGFGMLCGDQRAWNILFPAGQQ